MADMSAEEPFISLQNARKVYRSKGAEFLAVSDVTMDVKEGELVSLVMPAVRGKTEGQTTVRVKAPECAPQVIFRWGRGSSHPE